MTLIQSHGCFYKECISEALFKLYLSVELNYKIAISPIFDPSAGSIGLLVVKYTKENLQQILKTALEAQVLASNEPCDKLWKPGSPDMYCGKFYIEYYNFCQ